MPTDHAQQNKKAFFTPPNALLWSSVHLPTTHIELLEVEGWTQWIDHVIHIFLFPKLIHVFRTFIGELFYICLKNNNKKKSSSKEENALYPFAFRNPKFSISVIHKETDVVNICFFFSFSLSYFMIFWSVSGDFSIKLNFLCLV